MRADVLLAVSVLLPLAFVLTGPVAVTHAADYKGRNIDGQEHDGIAYSSGTNDSYVVKIRFSGNEAFLTFEDSRPARVIVLDSELVDDPHRIPGSDSQGIAWELNVNGLDDQAVESRYGQPRPGRQTPIDGSERESRSIVQKRILQAVKKHRVDVLSEMLQTGVDPNLIKSEDGQSALYIATKAADERVIGVLLKNGANPMLDSRESLAYLLNRALAEANNRFLEICLEKGLGPDFSSDELGDSLINASIKRSNLDAFIILLDSGAGIASVTSRNTWKTTLAIAVEKQGASSEYVRRLRKMGATTMRYTDITPALAESTTDKLRIRRLPSLKSGVVGFLMKGDRVHLLEVTPLSSAIDGMSSPWILVDRGDLKGWVFGGYLKGSVESEGYTGQSP